MDVLRRDVAKGSPMRLRGGFAITERVLEARMAKARAEVARDWFAQNISTIMPFQTWDAYAEQEAKQAPHVGFLAGTGGWIGPTLEQAEQAEAVDASYGWVADIEGEKKAKWMQFLGGKDGEGAGGWEEGEGGAKNKGEGDGWGFEEELGRYDMMTAGRGTTDEMREMLGRSGFVEGGGKATLQEQAREAERARGKRRRARLQSGGASVEEGAREWLEREEKTEVEEVEEVEAEEEREGAAVGETGEGAGVRGAVGEGGGTERERRMALRAGAHSGGGAQGGGAREQTGGGEGAGQLEVRSAVGAEEEEEEEVQATDLLRGPVLEVERGAEVGETISGSELRAAGWSNASAAGREGRRLKVLAVDEEADFFGKGVGLKMELVATESSEGASSDFDIAKAVHSSEGSEEDEYVAEARKYAALKEQPRFPEHGHSMKNDAQPDLNADKAWLSPMLATAFVPGPRPKKGVREKDLRPGGRLFEEARRLHGGMREGVVYRFPRRAADRAFVYDPRAEALREATADEEEAEEEEEWEESSREGNYTRYVHHDGQVFYDGGEAGRYAGLSALEKREYAVQRLTVLGEPDASYASIECGRAIPVYSSVAAKWGQYRQTMQTLMGPLPKESKEYKMMRTLTDYFPDRRQPPLVWQESLGPQVLAELERLRVDGDGAEGGGRAREGRAEEAVAESFIGALNRSEVEVEAVACMARYGMPELGSVWELEARRGEVHRLRSQLWRLLLGLREGDQSRWEAQAAEWRVVHERLVASLCKEAEHDPWELMDDYEALGRFGVVANWSESEAGGEGGFASMDFVAEDVAAAEVRSKGPKPPLDARWHRLWGNPSAVRGANGTVGVRRVAWGEQSVEERWRNVFAATALWQDIQYDTYNGTYPHLYALTPEERPVARERLEELRWKEEDGTLTAKEGEELWWAEQLHYDCVFGVYPALYLPQELAHVTTRIIFSYIRLHPAVTYSPDMHALLAPLLYVALRDPDHGVRDSLLHRDKSVAHRRLDRAEAAAFELFHAFASQLFRHWQPDPSSGRTFVEDVALCVERRLAAVDPEMSHNLFHRLQVPAEEFVPVWVSRLFAEQFPMWLLLPLWEAVLASPDRAARVAAICCALATAPAGRAPLFFAKDKRHALALLQYPPAVDLDALLLAAEAFLDPRPPPLAFPAFLASLSSTAEMRRLRGWGRGCLPKRAHDGQKITHIPYVNADGSAGFRKVGGGGFGYGICPSKQGRRAATRFSRSKEVVPRLRLLGSDVRAPLNFSALVDHFPPPPDVDWRPNGAEHSEESDVEMEEDFDAVGTGESAEETAGEAEAAMDPMQEGRGREDEESEESEEEDSSLLSADMRRGERGPEDSEEAKEGAEPGGRTAEHESDDGEDTVGDEDEQSEEMVFPLYRYNPPTVGQHDVDVRVDRQRLRAEEWEAKREELTRDDEQWRREIDQEIAGS